MTDSAEKRVLWGALWRSNSKLDGYCSHLLNEDCLPVLFRTRRAARDYIEKKYGYIKTRDDLRAQPHGWKMPIAVQVRVSIWTLK
jgi:hypothetical protein